MIFSNICQNKIYSVKRTDKKPVIANKEGSKSFENKNLPSLQHYQYSNSYIPFGLMPKKIIAQTFVSIGDTPQMADVVFSQSNGNIINFSLMKGREHLGHVSAEIQKDNLKILLIDTKSSQHSSKGVGTKLMQLIIETSIKFKKSVILDSFRLDKNNDNPVIFYFTRGFTPMDESICKQITEEIEIAAKEGRRANPNIFDKFEKITMALSEEGKRNWEMVISEIPILV